MKNTIYLHEKISAVCPINSVNSSRQIDFKPEATEEQRATAQAIANAWDFESEDLIQSYTRALDAYIDSVAQADKWDSRITCIARAGYPNQWQQRAIAFGVWMDTCYALAYQIMAEVQAGTRPLPSIDDFIGGMPVMEWPQ